MILYCAKLKAALVIGGVVFVFLLSLFLVMANICSSQFYNCSLKKMWPLYRGRHGGKLVKLTGTLCHYNIPTIQPTRETNCEKKMFIQ